MTAFSKSSAIEELADHERQARGEAGRLRRTIEDKTKAFDQLEVDFDAAIEELTQRFLEVKQYVRACEACDPTDCVDLDGRPHGRNRRGP